MFRNAMMGMLDRYRVGVQIFLCPYITAALQGANEVRSKHRSLVAVVQQQFALRKIINNLPQ